MKRYDAARVNALRQIPLFAGCSRKELRRMSAVMTEVPVETGRVLTVAGRPGDEFFVVLSGTAAVWRQGIQLDRLGPGSFFGELALLDHGDRTATVVAESEMRLLVLSTREFRSSQFLIRPIVESMLVVVGSRLRRSVEGWTRDVASPTRFDPPSAPIDWYGLDPAVDA